MLRAARDLPRAAAKLNRCPKCLSEVAQGAATCAGCGAQVGESPAASLQVAKRPQTAQRAPVLLIAAAAIGAAMVTFAALALRNGPSPTLSAASPAETPANAGASSSSPDATATSEVQRWNADNRRYWLAGRRGAAFELLAENKVHTWFGPTQPVLVIRCTSHETEAFVYTRSATRIEPHEGKTVTVSLDGEPAKTEQWGDSDDRVALFAPDGAQFVHRLLGAKTLRFGYSPHNADDVVAQFHVDGLARLIEPVARECGWKK
jgi:hypothetical protein